MRYRGQPRMAEREEAAFIIGAKPQALDGPRPVTVGGEHLATIKHKLDRAADDLCGHRSECDMRPSVALAAKAAADKRTNRAYLLGLEAKQFCERVAGIRDALGRAVDGQVMVVA